MSRAGLAAVLAIAAVVGLVFGLWPELDLALAAPFYDPARGGFWRSYDVTYLRLRDAATWVIVLVALPAAAALILKLVRPQRPAFIPGRAAVLMLVTLALAPGMLVNFTLKENWHRPRPIDVTEFRGDEHFRPWWDPRGDCPKNCSFVSGESSAAFWTLAPALLAPAPWQLLATAAALAFGAAVSLLRMAAGAHFFTDVAFAGVFTFLVIWLTHGFLYRWRRTRLDEDTVERMLARLRQASLRVVGRRDA
jgi:membrane-associated PAP2 superfamily phosphatase